MKRLIRLERLIRRAGRALRTFALPLQTETPCPLPARFSWRGGGGSKHLLWAGPAGILCLLAALGGGAQQTQQPPQIAPPNGTGRPWASAQVVIAPSTQQQSSEAANAERRKQIADDSAKLLKLATELKAEVDKTTKDTLSLAVIRKADEIEHLAKGVKEKMRASAGSD